MRLRRLEGLEPGLGRGRVGRGERAAGAVVAGAVVVARVGDRGVVARLRRGARVRRRGGARAARRRAAKGPIAGSWTAWSRRASPR